MASLLCLTTRASRRLLSGTSLEGLGESRMHEYPRETQGKPVERDIWQGCNILAPKEGGSKRYARQLPVHIKASDTAS